jgi:hypothetical protein
MTAKQIERIEKKIAAYRKALADEKRSFGGYHDGRGLRYEPPQYYLKLFDFKGAMTYFRWFKKNFDDDIGTPLFLFEWCITLFKNGKFIEAEKKALETFMSNTYLIDKFLDRPFHTYDTFQNSDWQRKQLSHPLPYAKKQEYLKSFALWLEQFVESPKFQVISKEFMEIETQLVTEPVGTTRSELVQRRLSLLEAH